MGQCCGSRERPRASSHSEPVQLPPRFPSMTDFSAAPEIPGEGNRQSRGSRPVAKPGSVPPPSVPESLLRRRSSTNAASDAADPEITGDNDGSTSQLESEHASQSGQQGAVPQDILGVSLPEALICDYSVHHSMFAVPRFPLAILRELCERMFANPRMPWVSPVGRAVELSELRALVKSLPNTGDRCLWGPFMAACNDQMLVDLLILWLDELPTPLFGSLERLPWDPNGAEPPSDAALALFLREQLTPPALSTLCHLSHITSLAAHSRLRSHPSHQAASVAVAECIGVSLFRAPTTVATLHSAATRCTMTLLLNVERLVPTVYVSVLRRMPPLPGFHSHEGEIAHSGQEDAVLAAARSSSSSPASSGTSPVHHHVALEDVEVNFSNPLQSMVPPSFS